MHPLTTITALVLALVLTAPLPAQYRCDHFTTEKGLPQNTVAGIAQTPDGYLWLATYDGLVRYDGVRFKVFDKANTPAIGCNWFLTVWVDPVGTLWAGTVEAGLLRSRDGVFRSFPVQTGRSDHGVRSIHASPTGTPLLGYDDLPLLSWDDVNLQASVAEPRLLRTFTDRFGVAWTLQQDVLVRTCNHQHTTFSVRLTDSEFATRRFVDSTGVLWLCTQSNGVYRIDGARLHHHPQLGLSAPTGYWPGGQDRAGTVWLFTEKEVIGYRDGRFTALTESDGLTSQHIRAVYCDREGTVWIGSNDRGLFKLARRFLTTYTEAEGLNARIIYPIVEDRRGAIWLGSKGALTRYSGGKFTSLPLPPPKPEDTDVRCLYEDRAGRLWVGTTVGLFVVAGERLLNRSETINGYLAFVCLEDRSGTFWVGTDNGLVRLRDGSRTVFTTQDGLPERRVRSLYEDRQGRLWVGTVAGLAVLQNDRFRPIGVNQTLLPARIRCLHEDESGTLWVGTYDWGLWRVRDGQLKVCARESGLPSNGVFQILEDRRGHFWMSCNRGILRVHRQQLDDYADGKATVIRCVTYGLEDGMKSIECNGERPPAGIRTRDGKLWFPTMHGVVVIDPDAVPDNAQPPRAVLEAALVDRAPVHLTAELQLQPGQSDLELHYTAPSFLKSEHVHFKYRLVGLSEKWTEAGPRRSAHYAHLPPGRYTFEVHAANSDGVWSEVGTTLAIEVLPFFYQTRWFAGLCIAGLVGLALGVGAVRVHRLKANARRLGELVAERTLQLEAANARLEELATRDALTGLANRRRFQDFLTQEWQRSRRTGAPLALVLLDVDFFKKFNDTHGHPSGDECLRRVAEVLRTTVNRATDLPARYGGEEFAVVLSDTNLEGARVVAEAIRSRIEALAIPHGASAAGPNVTVSLGIAVATGTGTSKAEELIESADQALYRAKAEGRNRWVENPAGSP